MKRIVVILGAGASIEFGAPATNNLTDNIERRIYSDAWMKHTGGDAAFKKIKETLSTHLADPGTVHYEHIYHCAHELTHFFPPNPSTVDEYRPLLFPFVQNNSGLTKSSLEALDRRILEAIYREIFAACKVPTCSLDSLHHFLERLQNNHVLRIYSTNHDDFPLQAVGNLYTGFKSTTSRFDVEGFWGHWNTSAVFHLHGSIHMGFGYPGNGYDINEILWFQNREDAYGHTIKSYPSGRRRQDGGQTERFPLITGLDKLSNIQQVPFCYYYAALAKDLIEADLIYVIGSGLGDLHINTWLHEARSRNPRTPLLFVDYWPDGLVEQRFKPEPKLVEMFHSLNIHIDSLSEKDFGIVDGWTVPTDRTCAVWDKGFQRFLANPSTLDEVLKVLGLW